MRSRSVVAVGRERRAQQADIAVTDAHPQPAEAGRRRGPVGFFGKQLGKTLLERKARHARDLQQLDAAHMLAPGKERKGRHRRARRREQRMGEGGDEHGLARPLETGDGDAMPPLSQGRRIERGRQPFEGGAGNGFQTREGCHQPSSPRSMSFADLGTVHVRSMAGLSAFGADGGVMSFLWSLCLRRSRTSQRAMS